MYRYSILPKATSEAIAEDCLSICLDCYVCVSSTSGVDHTKFVLKALEDIDNGERTNRLYQSYEHKSTQCSSTQASPEFLLWPQI